ncbi:MAG: VOC family protein [Ramlibacter sp.]
MTGSARIDHLVVAADTLAEGVAWCETTLGVTPGPGGEHPLMGTHNRLLRIATVDHPRAYFEIIASDPAVPAAPDGRRRWYDMDDPQLRATFRDDGPRLVHWVAQLPDMATAVAALAGLGIDRGQVLAVSRMTPRGLLQWQITVRDDGLRLFDGCLPSLIAWGDVHRAAAMRDSGITLQRLLIRHPQAPALREALGALGLEGVAVVEGLPSLRATLGGPRTPVRLDSKGL